MKTFSIINLLGQTVMQGDISDKTVNISNLKQGVYLIKFNSDKKQIIRRFIKE
ncbi:MAG TPA: T9SS type A sorting domain-containing protein [Flavobacteriia bacterium]|nr:T9SS type A sorting domain-containing protein [Flavobacteriia bacterium]